MSKKSSKGTSKDSNYVAFICNWCFQDDMGAIFESFPNLKPIRIMCTGRVNPGLILRAFAHGAGAVAVLGCEDDSCHYVSGNAAAREHAEKTGNLLALMGVSRDRCEFIAVSPDGGEEVAEAIRDWTSRLAGAGG